MQLQLGEHLITSRLGYFHHGIYIGDDKVIHYSGLADGLSAGPIEVTTLQSFAAGKKIKIRSYQTSMYCGQDAVERAYTRLGEECYDLHANNCEHFCSWVRTGNHVSDQVEFVQSMVGMVGTAVGEFRKQRFHNATIKDAAVKAGKETAKTIVKQFRMFSPLDRLSRFIK